MSGIFGNYSFPILSSHFMLFMGAYKARIFFKLIIEYNISNFLDSANGKWVIKVSSN